MIGVADIKQVLPHRFPILLVDRVLAVEPGRRLTAIKAVTGSEPCYQRLGDRASNRDYAYPAALLLESWAQAGVLLATWEHPNPDVLAGKVGLAGAMDQVSFGPPVYPGDVLEHRVRLVKNLTDTMILAGETVVDGTTVLEVGQFVEAQRSVADFR